MGTGVAHSVLLVALVIAAGLFLSRIKIGGISLGVTWILFAGIACGHFGMVLDPTTSHFVKEFGLILFIYSIGLQVGPGFFSSFRKGGVTYNMLATAIVLLGGVTAYAIHLVTGESLFAMIGVLYGAVTNTPGLGAAQQTFSDMHEGAQNSLFAQGYALPPICRKCLGLSQQLYSKVCKILAYCLKSPYLCIVKKKQTT